MRTARTQDHDEIWTLLRRNGDGERTIARSELDAHTQAMQKQPPLRGPAPVRSGQRKTISRSQSHSAELTPILVSHTSGRDGVAGKPVGQCLFTEPFEPFEERVEPVDDSLLLCTVGISSGET